MALVWATVAVCVLICISSLAGAVQVTVVCADLVGAGGVGVRVWPTLKASAERHGKTTQFRLLQMNWEAERLLEGDWVGVFEEEPRPPHLRPPPTPLFATSNRNWRAPQPLFWESPYSTRGTITTNYTQPRVELSVLARGGCVGPYVGFVRNGVCVAAECLATHPTWLYDHRTVLGSRSLRSLVLPGTHNAGSYSLVDQNDVVAAWVVCQDEDIISQLLYGNRYLDLRVGYYPETHELLWVNHDLVRWRPLQDVLDGVRGFLALSPDPVIIDIHRTPVGFNMPEALELLISLMNSTLGPHFVLNRYGPHVTLDDLWQIGKRVIFSFIDPTVSDYMPWVWPPVPQAWANAQTVDDLRKFLDVEMNKRFESHRLWAAMAHLTPTLWDLLFRSHVGVRGLTDRVSFSVTRWLRQRWGHMANIVATDFFRSNDIISVAIRTNLALSMCRPSESSRRPHTMRWSTGITLSSGSASTTTPPFVRRLYSGGAPWSTVGERHIHYPFVPVDEHIRTVFTAIPTRIQSVASGVTYQTKDSTWREIHANPDSVFEAPNNTTSSETRRGTPDKAIHTSSSVAQVSSNVSDTGDILNGWNELGVDDGLQEIHPLSEKDTAPTYAPERLTITSFVMGKTLVQTPLPNEDTNHPSPQSSVNDTSQNIGSPQFIDGVTHNNASPWNTSDAITSHVSPTSGVTNNTGCLVPKIEDSHGTGSPAPTTNVTHGSGYMSSVLVGIMQGNAISLSSDVTAIHPPIPSTKSLINSTKTSVTRNESVITSIESAVTSATSLVTSASLSDTSTTTPVNNTE